MKARDDAMLSVVKKAKLIATWMDGSFIDPILGFLLPGLGDVGGLLLGVYTVVIARRAGVSTAILARMLVNLAVDALMGAIPLVGDLFDFAFRAHSRNLVLLEGRPAGHAKPGDWLFLGAAVVLTVLALAVPIFSFVWIVKRILNPA